MAAPVLGGLLIADEVIDVFLPVLYFAVQQRAWAKLHRVNPWVTRAAALTAGPTPLAGTRQAAVEGLASGDP